jgi:nitrogen fixation/metabolism regulation signal transduction histidine kinase
MGYKNFPVLCTIRVIILAATSLLLAYLLFYTQLYATSVIITAAVAFQTIGLIRYVQKTNRDLARFISAIKHADFSQSFPDDGRGGSHSELRQAFSSIMTDFRKSRAEKQENVRYLQTVVQHVGVGVLAFTSDGRIDLINSAARRMLDIPGIRTFNDLRRVDDSLVTCLEKLRPGEKALVKIDRKGETVQLSVALTEFKLAQRSIKLVSLHNITGELDEAEMEAWQQLVRVLNHEIMNSVTPIASLASTAREIIDSDDGDDIVPEARLDDLRTAVETIEKRSEGLIHFVDAYRRLTRIPTPTFQIILLSDLFGRIQQLAATHPECANITLDWSIDPPTLEVTADPDLVEQILLNLIINAAQALGDTSNGYIDLSGKMNQRGRVIIQVADNGPGISPEALASVFIPFYTTKAEGSGIGLSLSRQIMRQHGGDITVTSVPNEHTVFTLRF